jgi:hypothetical protein
MKGRLLYVLILGMLITSCASFHEVPASYFDKEAELEITSTTMTMTPIVEIDRAGGVTRETIKVLEAPKNSTWAMLTIKLNAKDKVEYDFNKVVLITQKGTILVPYLGKISTRTSAILSPSYKGTVTPFLWKLDKGNRDYSLYFLVNYDDTPEYIKIGDSEKIRINIPPEDYKKKSMIVAS